MPLDLFYSGPQYLYSIYQFENYKKGRDNQSWNWYVYLCITHQLFLDFYLKYTGKQYVMMPFELFLDYI